MRFSPTPQLADVGLPVTAGGQLPVAFEHDDLSLRAKATGAVGALRARAAGGDCRDSAPVAAAEGPAGGQGQGSAAAGGGDAKALLAALRAEDACRQQLMPLMGCLGPQVGRGGCVGGRRCGCVAGGQV